MTGPRVGDDTLRFESIRVGGAGTITRLREHRLACTTSRQCAFLANRSRPPIDATAPPQALVDHAVSKYCPANKRPATWDLEALSGTLATMGRLSPDVAAAYEGPAANPTYDADAFAEGRSDALVLGPCTDWGSEGWLHTALKVRDRSTDDVYYAIISDVPQLSVPGLRSIVRMLEKGAEVAMPQGTHFTRTVRTMRIPKRALETPLDAVHAPGNALQEVIARAPRSLSRSPCGTIRSDARRHVCG